MRHSGRVAIWVLCLILIAGCTSAANHHGENSSTWPPNTGRGPCAVDKQVDVPATMRDGTVLRADVYRPHGDGASPVILMRTQYGKAEAQTQPWRYQTPDWFASHCYLVVVQDIRGVGRSDGSFVEYAHDQDDGFDTVEWAARLPGANGKVGMYGSSYVGATQWLAAGRTPPHLTTIVPANTGSDYYDGWTYEGGEFRLAFVLPWAMGLARSAATQRGDSAIAAQLLPAIADYNRWLNYRPYQELPTLKPAEPGVAGWYFDWLRHSTRDDFWQQWSIRDEYPRVTVPVLDIEGWYDAFLTGGIENFTGMVDHGGSPQARTHQRLVIGPWDHLGWGRSGSTEAAALEHLGPVGESPINELMLDWFDHFLKGTSLKGTSLEGRDDTISDQPRVDYFVMGANRWRTAPGWPLPNTRWSTYYLSGNGGASFGPRTGALAITAPTGDSKPNRYHYDPADPAPSLGGHSCCSVTSGPQGPFDQTPVEQRSDVLTFDSAPLTTDTEITGPTTVTLWASSTAPDTDFVARLEAVLPDGRALNLNNGIIRAALRDSLSNPTPLVPGQPTKFTIKIWPTSYQLPAGSKIRITVSSSDYPQYAPNPNTGAPFGADANSQPADQTIYTDSAHPSSVVLPIIPG